MGEEDEPATTKLAPAASQSGNTTARPSALAFSATSVWLHWRTAGGGGGGRSQEPALAAVVDALAQHLHVGQPEVCAAASGEKWGGVVSCAGVGP